MGWVTVASARGSTLDRRAQEFYDLLVANKKGVTFELVRAKLGWDRSTMFGAARRLRSILAGDKMTVTCTPRGQGETWLYQLTSSYDEVSPWHRNRIHDCESRLETIENVAQSIVNATAAMTADGRKSRLIFKTIHRLREDIEDSKIANGA